MFSVLYVADNNLYQIGPFKTEEEANQAFREAHEAREFDIYNQWVYLLTPDHRMLMYPLPRD